MKIIKLIKKMYPGGGHYYVVFDEIPEITYEKKEFDFVGSAVDSNNEIVLSRHLKHEIGNKCHAFAGKKISLKMKDGTTCEIRNNWYDVGSYQKHGEFVNIGASTLAELQQCYVYFDLNINKIFFEKLMEEYLSKDRVYTYKEIEEWCKLQYKWYNVIVNGVKIPYMMNKKGTVVKRESKKPVHTRYNVLKWVNGRYKEYMFFIMQYKDKNNKLIKIEANYLETLKATLPLSDEELKKIIS